RLYWSRFPAMCLMSTATGVKRTRWRTLIEIKLCGWCLCNCSIWSTLAYGGPRLGRRSHATPNQIDIAGAAKLGARPQRSSKMRHQRVVVIRYGGPEVITVAEVDIPSPAAGEVRVKVLAAGVSLPDVLAREGVHPETPRVPYTPGWDLVGTVD